ncbi:MAG: hypothetical protein F4Z52_09465 [Gammaproteobacteria bacterium]|nr:hypothetical protein [Gammaproteobacteria bacterium]
MAEETIHDLSRKHAVLEERMNTKQSEYKTDIEKLRTDMAHRDRQQLLAIFAMIALGVAFLGFLISLSN